MWEQLLLASFLQRFWADNQVCVEREAVDPFYSQVSNNKEIKKREEK
jgi:hypothetical protein